MSKQFKPKEEKIETQEKEEKKSQKSERSREKSLKREKEKMEEKEVKKEKLQKKGKKVVKSKKEKKVEKAKIEEKEKKEKKEEGSKINIVIPSLDDSNLNESLSIEEYISNKKSDLNSGNIDLETYINKNDIDHEQIYKYLENILASDINKFFDIYKKHYFKLTLDSTTRTSC